MAISRARSGVEGYYVRIAPDSDGAASPLQGFVPIKNRAPDQELGARHAGHQSRLAGPGPFRPARSRRSAEFSTPLKSSTRFFAPSLPQGPCWYRYNGDGYGEHEDGSPFDGTGIGRPWPLLAGERAHYEIAAGRPEIRRRPACA